MDVSDSIYDARLKHFRDCDEDEVLLLDELSNENADRNLEIPKLPVGPLNLDEYYVTRDEASNQTLAKFNMDYLTAVVTDQSGSSLFNAVSIGLYGTRKHASMLQYQVAVWFGKAYGFHDFFPKLNKSLSRFQVARSLIRSGFAANALTLPCICNALNISITSIYPPHNGLFDPEHRQLNRTFHPIFHDPANEVTKQVYLLWEGDYGFVVGKRCLWTPDRFVCCTPLISEPEPNFYRHSEVAMMAEEKDDEVYAKKLAKQGVPQLEGANPKSLDEFKGIKQGEVGTIKACYNYLLFCKNVFLEMPDINCSDNYFNFVVKLDSYDQLKNDRFLWKKEDCYESHFVRGSFLELYREKDGYHFSKAAFAMGTNTRLEPQPDDSDVIMCVTYGFTHLSTAHLRKAVTVVVDSQAFGTLALYEYFNELGDLLSRIDLN